MLEKIDVVQLGDLRIALPLYEGMTYGQHGLIGLEMSTTRYIVDLCMIIKMMAKRGEKENLLPYYEELDDVRHRIYVGDIKQSISILDLVERTCEASRAVIG